ncbi:MAG: GTP cyclohydrolase FolE2 [Verrucomicrobium sp.]|nr:GTP cyclohydrolase FolE2 [Verrucomicrobium sp.]
MKKASVSSLTDRQGERDDRNIPIDQVGIKGLRHPIEVRDRKFAVQHTVGTFAMTVDLPREFKGTHMSRFVEILQAHGRLIHVESIAPMLRELQARLHAQVARLSVEFPYFVEKEAPVTGSLGQVDYGVRFDATASGKKTDFLLTVVVPVSTLCPCSKAISARGAHNQRGYVTLTIRFAKRVWIEELIELVEASASAPLYSLLKRPDEKFVTEQAYDNPVFVEDLVRNVAVRCNRDPRIAWYRVEAENMESIHNHAAYACVEKRAGKAPVSKKKARSRRS